MAARERKISRAFRKKSFVATPILLLQAVCERPQSRQTCVGSIKKAEQCLESAIATLDIRHGLALKSFHDLLSATDDRDSGVVNCDYLITT